MEEKKLNELADETLDTVAGGEDSPHKSDMRHCPFCRQGFVPIPRYGNGEGQCTVCHTTFRSQGGELLY